LSVTEELLTVLEFFAVGNYLRAALFMLSRVAELTYDLKYLQFSRFTEPFFLDSFFHRSFDTISVTLVKYKI